MDGLLFVSASAGTENEIALDPVTIEAATDGSVRADDEIPGFGIKSTVAALGGAGYVLKRQFGRDQKDKGSDSLFD